MAHIRMYRPLSNGLFFGHMGLGRRNGGSGNDRQYHCPRFLVQLWGLGFRGLGFRV